MKSLSLLSAAKIMNASLQGEDCLIQKVESDTRKISPGDLFVAIPGARVDGHDYSEEAKKNGAVAALISRPIKSDLPTLMVPNTVEALGKWAKAHREQFQIPIAALTGSCGKTTVKEMIAAILEGVGPTLATHGNLNTEVGVPLTLLQLSSKHQRAVIEMGARKQGDISYLMNLVQPSVSLITNAGVAHLEIFGSERGIAEAKGEIYSHLPVRGTAVINADDPHAHYWQGLIQKEQNLITFGLKNSADVMAKNVRLEAQYSEFDWVSKDESIKIKLPVPGIHNVQNALAASATARALGVSVDAIKKGLERFSAATGRLQFKVGPKNARIIDDTYNANPVSVRAGISVLVKYSGQRIFVMGDMFELGPNAIALHGEMGKEAKALGIDRLLGVGTMTETAVQAFGEGARHFADKSQLIEVLRSLLTSETTVLVKGSRGMRMEEVVEKLTQQYQEEHSC